MRQAKSLAEAISIVHRQVDSWVRIGHPLPHAPRRLIALPPRRPPLPRQAACPAQCTLGAPACKQLPVILLMVE